MLYYKGSSRQLRKLRHQLLKAGFGASSELSKYTRGAKGVYIFEHSQRYLISGLAPDPEAADWIPDFIYTGRQYKQALQALNIPV